MASLSGRRPICNNNPSSAPVVNGRPFILCWRCCGIGAGALIFAPILLNIVPPVTDTVTVMAAVLMSVPALIDHSMNRFGLKKPSNVLRFITGMLLGIAIMSIEMILIRSM